MDIADTAAISKIRRSRIYLKRIWSTPAAVLHNEFLKFNPEAGLEIQGDRKQREEIQTQKETVTNRTNNFSKMNSQLAHTEWSQNRRWAWECRNILTEACSTQATRMKRKAKPCETEVSCDWENAIYIKYLGQYTSVTPTALNNGLVRWNKTSAWSSGAEFKRSAALPARSKLLTDWKVIIRHSTIAKWPMRQTGGPEGIGTHMQLSFIRHANTQCHAENPIMPVMESYLSPRLFISGR